MQVKSKFPIKDFQDRSLEAYSDFLVNLNTHPVRKDIVRLANEQAVIRSVKNLLLTNTGERLMQPTIGTSLRKLLFEPMDPMREQDIATLVKTTIDNYEPRAKIFNVNVIADYDQNAYLVKISMLVINNSVPSNFTIVLSRD